MWQWNLTFGYSVGLVENNDGDDNDNDNNNHYLVSTYFLENSMCFAYIVINSFDNSAIKFNLFAF